MFGPRPLPLPPKKVVATPFISELSGLLFDMYRLLLLLLATVVLAVDVDRG